ncbi:peptidylprolyl isomerase [Parachryseolinea silvisoli]|jgi:peptidyl-prolyl cis-trans isomerase SurA|uniref:peptidylprolyl isomerase n=1 Tax=Parachryseolinea silvisoli TaxID=2873601 RepID=UPI002265BD48|nr:peptidylprolyl isomerase [Parachryseolinea silvisoli]MCD9015962.1 peptidylprolyl isomerase [Parachryseolinea silvisoli]
MTLTLFAGVMAFQASAQESEEATGFVVDEIISKVDNYIVLKSDLDRLYQDQLTNGRPPGQQLRCQLMAMLIRNKLMMAKAEIDSVMVLDAEVDANTQRRMDMILSQSGRSPDELEELYGKPLEQIRSELRDQVREQMIVNKMEGVMTDGLVVTPAEVRRFFSKIPKDSLPYFSASVEVAQIVKIAKVSEEQKNITRTELVALRNRLLAGEDWATLAKKYSSDPSVITNGGDMGWSGRGRMVPEYEATAFRLKPNEISMPFESPFGFHVMQLLERRGNEYHSRHILISPKPSESDLAKASKNLDSIRTLIVNDSIKFQKAAKEFSDDVETKGNGGFFSDANGGIRLMVDELDPVVFFKLDSMQIGDISHPIVYRTDDGKDAVRILYYRSRIAPHQASLEADWSRIQDATLNEKKDRILQKWFQKARKDVFISIDQAYDYCGILDE